MAKISTYGIDSTPQFSDKLIGTSITGPPDNNTANFTLQSVIDLFLPEITLQKVTESGNTTTLPITANSFIKSGGTASQFLKADGSIDSNVYVTTNIYNSNGALSGDRVVTMGAFTLSFTKDILVNGLTIGVGSGSGTENTANGYQALYSNTTGSQNAANGYQALFSNTTGTENVAVGANALRENITGVSNTAVGQSSLRSNTIGIATQV